MARQSVENTFSGAARSLLAVQLFVSVLAIALAAWTMAVTADIMRERDSLRERVIQLEAELAARGVVVPEEVPTVVGATAQGAAVYPGSVAALSDRQGDQGFGAFLGEILAPVQPLSVVVLHARAENADVARKIAVTLTQSQDAVVLVNTLNERSARPPGYVYYDGRQSRAAAAIVARFHDAAREAGAAAWSAQLRGEALPADGEYTSDRLDIVLPPLPASAQAQPTPALTRP